MAIRLKQEGEHDFVLLERADDIGGTWRDNTYPGCRCDVPSHLYSFSFAPNPNWSRTFSPQPEILDYLKDCAERFGVLPHVRFDTELERAELGRRRRALADRDARTARSPRTSSSPAQGPLSEPALPELPGLERFEGTAFHSAQLGPRPRPHRRARGRDRHRRLGDPVRARDPAEGRAGCTSSSARRRGSSRTATGRSRLGAQRSTGVFPPAQLAMRAGIYWARELFVLQFRHPRVQGCRALAAHGTCARRSRTRSCARSSRRTTASAASASCPPTSGIRRWRSRTSRWSPTGSPRSGRTPWWPRTGREREVDTIIFGTGFHVTDIPIADRVRGRDGRSLAETWNGQHAARTRARRSPATRTCSSWSGRTPASDTPRSCS